MCPRATTAQHYGAPSAMASVCSFVDEEYIDLDLSSCCGELEFRVRRSGAADEELPCRGRPAHKAKVQEVVDAAPGCGGGAGRRSAATVAPLQHSQSAAFRDAPSPVVRLRTEASRRRKAARTVHAKLQASRAFFRSLFARTSCSDEQCRRRGAVRAGNRAPPQPQPPGDGEAKQSGCPAPLGQNRSGYRSASGRAAPTTTTTTLRSSIEQEKLMDEAELAARQRKSFSGVIKWRHAAPAPGKPLSSSSSSSRRSAGPAALKRSSSARSESEGLIQGAIAYCKRSQQQLGLAGRKSVSDAALCPAPSWPSLAYCH